MSSGTEYNAIRNLALLDMASGIPVLLWSAPGNCPCCEGTGAIFALCQFCDGARCHGCDYDGWDVVGDCISCQGTGEYRAPHAAVAAVGDILCRLGLAAGAVHLTKGRAPAIRPVSELNPSGLAL